MTKTKVELKTTKIAATDLLAIGRTFKKDDVERAACEYLASKERVSADKIKLKTVERLITSFAYDITYQIL